MKTKIKLWLFFGFLYLFGAFLSAGLVFTYGLSLLPRLSSEIGNALSFSDFVLLACRFLRPLLLIFLSAFTVFSCAVSSASCLAVGLLMGQTVMHYCRSPLSPFTHPAGLALLLGFGALFTVLSSLSALYRSSLKTAAPDLKVIARDKKTYSLLYSFLTACAVSMALSAALYFLLFYFPLS